MSFYFKPQFITACSFSHSQLSGAILSLFIWLSAAQVLRWILIVMLPHRSITMSQGVLHMGAPRERLSPTVKELRFSCSVEKEQRERDYDRL